MINSGNQTNLNLKNQLIEFSNEYKALRSSIRAPKSTDLLNFIKKLHDFNTPLINDVDNLLIIEIIRFLSENIPKTDPKLLHFYTNLATHCVEKSVRIFKKCFF